ncbi:helix-turn-helix domain-containing protein [Aeromicrobium sp. S22]|uniref:transcriptional regulator n=1 Tax=Aeromicrobium sp. S22 TaxID=2662029 RepID=UPI00129D4E8D|nr:transcriptional regulator [Aeromicrobium sp. S22]MRK01262.1 helix-turn-helix domain-containing protein [Aeromicrobium sp. S22]
MSDLDPLIHAPARLRLCAMLSVVDDAQFATVRERLDVSDSVLSKHVSALVDAGYVVARKGALDGRRTTWLALTSAGRKAFAAHVAALRAVIDATDETG